MDRTVTFLQEQVALPHNHEGPDCPTWCCVRRATEFLLLLGAPVPPFKETP